MQLSISMVAVWLLLGADAAQTDRQVRAAIERSLPFVQAEGERWIAEKKCVTCHQVPFMVWALNAAAERGIELDRQKRDECGSWAIDWKNMATKEDLDQGEQHTLARHTDPVAQLLLARSKSDASAMWPELFAERLAAGQQDDGSWKAGGQLPSQKRPERETQEVSTMWSLIALQSCAAPADAVAVRFSKAREWLGSKTEGQSTEWWAVRLLLECGSGNEAEATRLRDELVRRQHDDGGWGWLCRDESDAFGTGVAIYALARAGTKADESALRSARQFLIKTQQADGSWAVKGTKKAKAKQIEATATYWGTCWAVIGLAETLRGN
jgi:squalene-hopene/tetraprenyl-beta-curcumene cyclase